jgi:hypothetical protein
MTEHSITPPPELVAQWVEYAGLVGINEHQLVHLATQAARWGSDQELEACCEWLGDAPVVYNDNGDLHPGAYLRDARRSKMLSLKERALMALEDGDLGPGASLTPVEVCIIRRALEQLDD